jgi:hypothetical protein
MKAKRVIAWLLVCVLQLGVCLLVPMTGLRAVENMEVNGETYNFAFRSIRVTGKKNYTAVEVMFPPQLNMPEDERLLDTTVFDIEVGEDGLARVREHTATWEEAAQHMNPPVWDLYNQTATWLVSKRVQDDCEILTQIMNDLRSYNSAEIASPAGTEHFSALAEQIQEPVLRDLACRQIEAQNADELFDSYITGVLYEGEIYWREVYIAGLHIATLHS